MYDKVTDTKPADVRLVSTMRLSRKQLQAGRMAEQANMRKVWKVSVPFARETWTKLSPEEIGSSGGNVHKLAGLIQLRYGTTREEADRQVAEFLTTRLANA